MREDRYCYNVRVHCQHKKEKENTAVVKTREKGGENKKGN